MGFDCNFGYRFGRGNITLPVSLEVGTGIVTQIGFRGSCVIGSERGGLLSSLPIVWFLLLAFRLRLWFVLCDDSDRLSHQGNVLTR